VPATTDYTTDPCVGAAICVNDVLRVCGARLNWFSADQFVDQEIDYLDQELSSS